MTMTSDGFFTAICFAVAAALGAVIAAGIYHFTRRTQAKLAQLVNERDAKERLLDEMRKLEKFRRDFISNLTHEIRTPLTGILGAVEVLCDGEYLSDSDKNSMLNILKEQSIRLDKLAQDILALARIEHTSEEARRSFAACDLSDVVKNVFTLMKPKAAANGVALLLLKNEHVHPWHKREGSFPWSFPEFPHFVQKLLPRIATGSSHKHMLATSSHCQNIWTEKCI